MENNKNRYPEIPLDELRARYLGKKPKYYVPLEQENKYSQQIQKQIVQSQPYQKIEPSTNDVQDESIDSLRGKYLKKKASVHKPQNNRSGTRLLCDVLLLFSIIVVGITTFCFFAIPTTEIGGRVYYGKTINIFDFIWNADNSMINQIKFAIDQLSETDIDSDQAISAISSVMKMFRLIFLLIPTIIIGIKTIIKFITGTIYFFHKKSAKLVKVAVTNISQNLLVYVFFVFFGSVSGGVGEDAYYVGYTVDKGMTVGIIIGLVLLVIASIIIYLSNKKTVIKKTDGTNVWINSFIAGIGYILIAVVLTFMRIYSVFVYTLTASLSSAILSIQNGFEIKALIFPMLNLLLFVVCVSMIGKASNGFNGAFRYLLCYGDKTLDDITKTNLNKKSANGFKLIIVSIILSIAAVYVLSVPTFGYGWAVDIYYELVYIFIIASISQTFISFFKNKEKS